MFDDYVLYLLESLHCQERANELMRAMKGEGSTGERNFTRVSDRIYLCCLNPRSQEFSCAEWVRF